MNPLEKQLRSWTPRRPSAKIALRLFARAERAPVFFRRADVWNWLTPVAACVFTVLVLVNGFGRHSPRTDLRDNATFFASLMFNAASSNVQRTLVLSGMDENVEWNVWPHPFMLPTLHRSAPRAALDILSLIPTNR
jgi:hypothetical protein